MDYPFISDHRNLTVVSKPWPTNRKIKNESWWGEINEEENEITENLLRSEKSLRN